MADPVAVYGAVIGTAAAAGAIWNIYHGWWRDRARLHLEIVVSSNILEIKVVNAGRRPITVAEVGVCYTSGHKVCAAQRLPAELKEGQVLTRSLRFVFPDGESLPPGSPCHYFAKPAAGKRVKSRLPNEAAQLLKGRVLDEVPFQLI